jgi:hypothetical protein
MRIYKTKKKQTMLYLQYIIGTSVEKLGYKTTRDIFGSFSKYQIKYYYQKTKNGLHWNKWGGKRWSKTEQK